VEGLALPGKLRRTDNGLVFAEASVGLFRVRRLRFDPRAVRQRQLVDGITDAASLSPCAHAEDEARAVARANEEVSVARLPGQASGMSHGQVN
jgi:hypothetical protein